MASLAGYNVTIKVGNSSSPTDEITGINNVSIADGRTMLDVPTFENNGGAMERLAGLRDVSVTLSGFFNQMDDLIVLENGAYTNFDAEALALVNAYRAAGATCGDQGSFAPAPALAWNAALTQASLVHSDDMMALNFFSHTGSGGSNAGQRATAAGYAWQTWGENIAAGQMGVANVMAAWLASPGHCANLMNARFRDIGLACVSGGASNRYRTYWTMTLGTAR